MVLKENMKVQENREKKGKFEPTWLGPYVVTMDFSSKAYKLSTLLGEILMILLASFTSRSSMLEISLVYPTRKF